MQQQAYPNPPLGSPLSAAENDDYINNDHYIIAKKNLPTPHDNQENRIPFHESNRNSKGPLASPSVKDQSKGLQIEVQPMFKGERFSGQVWSREDELKEIRGRDFGKQHNNNHNQRSSRSPSMKKIYSVDDDIEKIDDDDVIIEGVRRSNKHEKGQEKILNNKHPKVFYSNICKEWWKDSEIESQSNCTMIYNLASKVDEEILFELFSKVGRIKRMKLFRITNHEINESPYLKSLSLQDFAYKPHKKHALIEYHSPIFVDSAIKVFDGLELFNRTIYVLRYRKDNAKYQIHIHRPRELDHWFDAYFCLDYFSEITNLLRVSIKNDKPKVMKIILHFPTNLDWEQAKKHIAKNLKRFLDKQIQIHPFISKDSTMAHDDGKGEEKSRRKRTPKRSSNFPHTSNASPFKASVGKDPRSPIRSPGFNRNGVHPGEI